MNNIQILLLFLAITMVGCFEVGETYSKLPPGPWRAVLKLDPEKNYLQTTRHETKVSDNISFDEVTEGDLPFNFEIVYDDPENFHLVIKNADERIIVNEITFRKDRATNKDTLTIKFQPYDSYLKVIYEETVLEGYWHVPSRGNYQIHFVAKHGQNHRFTTLQKSPVTDLSGKWEVVFGLDDSIPEPAIGYFKQNGNHLTGTFETESGDFRYLEGTVQANKMYLSCFDGAHMYLLEALIKDDGSLSGIFRNGIHFITSWSGKRNENATLRDPNLITTISGERFEFAFPDEHGDILSSDDPSLAGRPKIVQILGTWCPNCLDETRFLMDYIQREKPDIAFVGLAFERHTDPGKAMEAIARYRQKLQIPFPILFAGSSDKIEASRKLPMLNQVFAYPTLIFIDSENRVKKIHTGFSGPATPNYQSFVKEFQEAVSDLMLSQKI